MTEKSSLDMRKFLSTNSLNEYRLLSVLLFLTHANILLNPLEKLFSYLELPCTDFSGSSFVNHVSLKSRYIKCNNIYSITYSEVENSEIFLT